MISRECEYCGESPENRIKSFLKTIQKLYMRYTQWRIIRENCRHMQKMDDRMLADIGISRADVVRLSTGYGFFKHMCGCDKSEPKSKE